MPTASTPTPDPILETQVFWNRFKTPILVGLAVVLLGLVGYVGYRIYTTHRDDSAAALLAQAKTPPDYEKVISQYGGSGAAVSAYLFLAAKQREKQQFAEANQTLEKFINAHPKHELVTTAKMALAANLESLGKTDEALEGYRRIAADYALSYNAPLALLAEVPLLKAKGQVAEARQVCETILTQYRESYAAMDAQRLLPTLKPATPRHRAGSQRGPRRPAPSRGRSLPGGVCCGQRFAGRLCCGQRLTGLRLRLHRRPAKRR